MPNKNSKTKKKDDEVDFSYLGSKNETAEERTVNSRRRIRQKINEQVKDFLKNGGKIEEIESNTTSSPPKKPKSNYGNRPI